MKEATEFAAQVFYQRLGEWISDKCSDEYSQTDLVDAVRRHCASRERILKASMSPIEEILGNALLFNIDGYNDIQLADNETQVIDDFGSLLHAQRKVLNYTADFVIECWYRGLRASLVIECDGHDYHERTKEQAARDRRRDREMTSAGYTVVRFTGSEIYRDPFRCAEEVENLTYKVMSRLLVSGGAIVGA